MTNKEIYRKTLVFSVRRLLIDFIGVALMAGMCVLGFIVLDKTMDQGIIGLFIGLIVGIIIMAVIAHFISYSLKAGQIAMMTRGITDGVLPENVYAEGKAVVKKRFATVAAYYAITNVIKGIFNQIGKGITAVGEMVGGDAGSTVGSAISSAIQVVVAYLCDCCLGWCSTVRVRALQRRPARAQYCFSSTARHLQRIWAGSSEWVSFHCLSSAVHLQAYSI